MKGASTIVVGGGILGATTAWELARAGMDVLLLEAGRFGEQSTGRSAAIVRCHYSNPEVVRMAVRSRDRFRQLPLHLGCDPVYTRCGWLFLVDEENAPLALENAAMQEEEGLEAVEVDELQAYLPGVEEAGIAYALFEPDAGFADPVAATNAYVSALRALGGRALDDTAVASVVLEPDRARGVLVGDELLGCDNLVLAAGPWTLRLAGEAGLELPLEITREQDVVFETAPAATIPCAVSSQIDRVYLRPAPEYGDGHLLVGRGFPKDYELVDPLDYDEEVDEAFERDVHERVSARLPRLAGMRRVAGRVGLYDVTPDWHPILGAVDGLDGLFLATGGSGHCFKLGPAIGEIVADAILDRPPAYADVKQLLAVPLRRGPRIPLDLRREPGLSIELVIRGGTILDGSGGEPFAGDVAIEAGTITAVGSVPATECPEIDATGLYVAPGFIDIHSHSDYTLLVDPRAKSAIHQGVTLEVVGNCGFGCFPIDDAELARKAIYGYSEAVPIEWKTAGGYFDRLQAARPAVNVLSLVPNGQLRLSTVGLADRPADPGELAEMTRLLEQSLAEGAWGYSTGLEYAQEAGATEEEVAALCRVLAPGGGLYATHTRRRDAGAADSVAEAIRVATASAVRLQVSHLVPRNGIEEARRSTELVEAARARGLDVEFDMHTRTFGLTHLYAALPPWALAEPPSALATILRDPAARERMRPHRSILSAGADWGRIVLLDNPFWPEYARRDLASIAAERGQAPLDTVYDLLSGALDAPHKLMVIIHAYTEEEQREAFAHPLCVPGSDATTLSPDGPLADSCFHGAYTWASWFYRFMVRDERLLSPAQAVHKLTAQPAARLGLSDRGTLAPRAFADVAVFDPARFAERGTTFEPNQLAEGMVHVLVNGVHTLRDGRLTGERAGRVLRR